MSEFKWPQVGGSGNGVQVYPTFANLPVTALDGTAAITKDTDTLYIYNVASSTWKPIADPHTLTQLTGDVSAQGYGSVAATVNTVGGSTASNIHSAELLANAATTSNTASTIVKRNGSGQFSGDLLGSSTTFTGSLLGDVTGTQSATVVSTVGGSSAANLHTAEVAANAATSLNTASAIVKRDSSGNFTAGTISGNISGNVDSTGTLSIGTSSATAINIGRAGITVNIQGTTITENSTVLNVTNPNIELNTGGGVASAANSGVQIQENSVVTAYAETSADRNSWILKAPATTGVATITPGSSGLTIDQSVAVSSSPSFAGVTVSGLNSAGVVHTNSSGTLSTSQIVNADVSSGASIAYSKLNLATSVTNTDLSTSANIDVTKIAHGTANQVLLTNSGGTANAWGQLPLNQTTAVTGQLAIGNGGTGASTKAAAFDALSPNTSAGDVTVFNGTTNTRQAIGTDGQVLVVDSTQANKLKWATLQQGAKNYILYNNFENNATAGWSLAHTALTSSFPTSTATAGTAFSSSSGGTAAAGALAISTISSGQLAGSYSLSLASSAASTAGDCLVSQAYSIDQEDQAKVLTIKAYYKAVSGTFDFSGTSTNTFAVYIYDVTSGAWIQPAGVYGMTQGTGVGYVTGTFQTPFNMSQFQIAIINLNATAGAYTLYVDDFYVGPQTAPLGAAISDWTSYTPTLSGFTASATTARWRRVGDTMQLYGNYTISANSGEFRVSLPSGYSYDTSKMVTSDGTIGNVFYETSTTGYTASVAPVPSSTNLFRFQAGSTGSGGALSNTNPGTTVVVLGYFAQVPITGWSSNTVMSNDYDGRIISFSGTQSSQAVTANTTNVSFTTSTDRAGAWNGTQYVVPSPGDYWISASAIAALTGTAFDFYVNGSHRAYSGSAYTNGSTFGGAALLTALITGDLISVKSTQSTTITSGVLGINKLSGNTQTAASESVNCRYITAAGQSIPNGISTPVVVNFDSKVYDSHSSVSTGSGWRFIAPTVGKYRISTWISFSSNASGIRELDIFKNGVQNAVLHSNTSAQSSTVYTMSGSTEVDLLATEYIDVRVLQSSGTSLSLFASSAYNGVTVSRVGN